MILVFSVMRQGSSYFIDLLNNFNECKFHSEVFHEHDLANHDYNIDMNYCDIMNWKKSYPIDYLKSNYPYDNEYFGFKIFDNHLKSISQGDINENLYLLHYNFHINPILLLRRPIDTFISFKKFQETGKTQKLDTTDLTVTLNPQEFLKFWENKRKYFLNVKNIFPDLLEIHYEDLNMDYLKSRLKEKWNFSLTYDKTHVSREKQDKETDFSKKINNREEFFNSVKENCLYRYF